MLSGICIPANLRMSLLDNSKPWPASLHKIYIKIHGGGSLR